MSNLDISNAKITSTQLGYEDHGILTCFLFLNFQDDGCGFGGYEFDQCDKENNRRTGTAYGTEAISRILKTVGVQKWEDLKGRFIRAERDIWRGKILRIGNLIEDKWFSFEELAEEMNISKSKGE